MWISFKEKEREVYYRKSSIVKVETKEYSVWITTVTSTNVHTLSTLKEVDDIIVSLFHE